MRPAFILVVLGLSGAAAAQPTGALGGGLPVTLVFERIGPLDATLATNAVAFDADTVYADFSDRVARRTIGGIDWTADWDPNPFATDRRGRGDFRFDADGRIYQARQGFRYDWTDDRGATWTRADYPATVVPLHTPGGDLLGTWNEVPYGIARSEDDGATWTPSSFLTITDSALPYVYRVLPPTEARPGYRIVACGKEALAYSDDDGRTWTPSAVSGAVLCRSMVEVEGSTHIGSLLAAVDDFRGPAPKAGIWRTTDGATWDRVGQVFEDGRTVYLAPSLSGVVLAWERSHDRVAGTEDGGATWRLLTASLSGDPRHWLNDLEVGPDGHVYGAVELRQGNDSGLYRSVAPVFKVAEESEPEASASVGVSVWPNPSGGRVTVGLKLASPGVVRVSVLDALGREVAVLHDGPGRDGQRVDVDTDGWPTGAYTVRVVTEAGGASAGLTVVR